MKAHGRITVAFAVLLIIGITPVGAQSNQDIAFADFQFNRSLPGARSLGMGGAFVALAHDATAAFANPAGLIKLRRPEISLEGRSWTATSRFVERGRITGAPTGIGIDQGDFVLEEVEGETEGLSFASYVHPLPARRLAFGLFHHVLADYHIALASQGVFTGSSLIPRFGPYLASTELKVTMTGASLAHEFRGCWQENTSCLRLGVTLGQYELDLLSRTRVFPDPPPDGKGLSDFRGPLGPSAITEGDDTDFAIMVGLLWESDGRWTVGAAYRMGPGFDIQERVFSPLRDARLKLPDQFAVGVSVEAFEGFFVSFQYDRVKYSALREENGFEVFEIPDANEYRLGLEKVFFSSDRPGAPQYILRAGAWLDPDHRIRFQGEPTQLLDQFRQAYFGLPLDDDEHYSVGGGIHLGRFQLDAGYDSSGRIDTVAVSAVYRF